MTRQNCPDTFPIKSRQPSVSGGVMGRDIIEYLLKRVTEMESTADLKTDHPACRRKNKQRQQGGGGENEQETRG